MKSIHKKLILRNNRARRVRAKIKGTAKRPRLSVFRSLKHISVQLIDDEGAKTILSVSDKEVTGKHKKTELAQLVGELVAKKAKAKKIEKIVFDRGSNSYHGRVKAVAEGARKGGLKF